MTPTTLTELRETAERDEAVWRICHLTEGRPCQHCPHREKLDDEWFVRGCYSAAEEIINTVETGNPWRKTEDVRAPWVVLPDTSSLLAALEEAEKALERSRGFLEMFIDEPIWVDDRQRGWILPLLCGDTNMEREIDDLRRTTDVALSKIRGTATPNPSGESGA